MTDKKKILIIEDEEDFATLVTIRLEEAGFEVALEPNGDHAISRIKESKPSLVILDYYLSKGDGFTVIRKMKADAALSPIPVILVTGKAVMMEDVFRVEGAVEFFKKPVDMKILVNRVKELTK